MLPRVTEQVLHQLMQEFGEDGEVSRSSLIYNRLKQENPEFVRVVDFLIDITPKELGNKGDDLVLNSVMMAYRALELAELYRDASALVKDASDPLHMASADRVGGAEVLAKGILDYFSKKFKK